MSPPPAVLVGLFAQRPLLTLLAHLIGDARPWQRDESALLCCASQLRGQRPVKKRWSPTVASNPSGPATRLDLAQAVGFAGGGS